MQIWSPVILNWMRYAFWRKNGEMLCYTYTYIHTHIYVCTYTYTCHVCIVFIQCGSSKVRWSRDSFLVQRNTSEANHCITFPTLISELPNFDVNFERKTPAIKCNL